MPAPPNPDAIARLLWLAAPWALVFARVAGLAWTAPGWSTAGLPGAIRGSILAADPDRPRRPAGDRDPEPGRPARRPGAGHAPPWSRRSSARRSGPRRPWSSPGRGRPASSSAPRRGLSPASLLDPDAGDGLNVLGHLYGWVALGVFLGPERPDRARPRGRRQLRRPPGRRRCPARSAPADLTDGLCAAVARALALALRACLPPGAGPPGRRPGAGAARPRRPVAPTRLPLAPDPHRPGPGPGGPRPGGPRLDPRRRLGDWFPVWTRARDRALTVAAPVESRIPLKRKR